MKINHLYNNDCLKVLKTFPDNSVDSIVTDPPAGISFMGKEWDTFDHSMFDKKGEEGENDLKVKKNFEILPRYANADLIGFQNFICAVFSEAIRVLKPGGHTLVWAIPRTSHHTAMGLERAGFEIRDCVYHIFGSGFPKSLDISKAIDKRKGVRRKVIGRQKAMGNAREKGAAGHYANAINSVIGNKEIVKNGWDITEPATKEAKQWAGWGTALKPAVECWWLCRKPMSEKTIVDNVLKYGTSGLNIDACRIKYTKNNKPIPQIAQDKRKVNSKKTMYDGQSFNKSNTKAIIGGSIEGRFPSHLITDGSPEKIPLKYFYTAKAGKKEKNMGLNDIEAQRHADRKKADGIGGNNARNRTNISKKNFHPTVKPIALMKYLIKLITPKDGIVLDCFAGSGSTLVAATKLKVKWIGIEIDKDYCKIANKRIKKAQEKMGLGIFAV